MKEPDITSEELKKYVTYNPLTGIFTRIKKLNGRGKARLGIPIGHKDGRGYIHFSLLGKKRKAHRLAWLYFYGVEPPEIIDHIDGVRTNNRISNLRGATANQNQHNTRKITSLSGYKGVYPCRNKDKEIVGWIAQCAKVHLGLYIDARDAAIAYDRYVVKVFEDYAATNKSILGEF